MINNDELIKKFNQILKECGIEESLEETASDMLVLNKLVEKNKKLLDMFQRYDNDESMDLTQRDIINNWKKASNRLCEEELLSLQNSKCFSNIEKLFDESDNIIISKKYKKLFTTWHCPTSNQRDMEKKEEITFYPNGTYKSKKDNGFGILLETQDTYKIKYDCLYFKGSIYEIRVTDNTLTLRTKTISNNRSNNSNSLFYMEYETIKYLKSNYKLKSLDTLHQMPRNSDECLDLLNIIVKPELKEKLIQKDEEKEEFSFLTTGHFGIGLFIRNAFGLWGSNPYLNVRDPDRYSEGLNENFKTLLRCERYFGINLINNFKNDPKTYSNGILLPNEYMKEKISYDVLIKYVPQQEALLLIIHNKKLRYEYINKVIKISYEDSILTLENYFFLHKIHLKYELDMSEIKLKTQKLDF